MEKKVEGAHTGFLRQITGKQACQIGDGIWETPREEFVWGAAGMQSDPLNVKPLKKRMHFCTKICDTIKN